MKRALTSLALFGVVAAGGLTATAGSASAAVEPGLYRLCPVAVNVPGTYACRSLTMRQYIGEIRAFRLPGFGYGPLVSTPNGGYLAFEAFGNRDSGRVTFVKTTGGYDVLTSGAAVNGFNSKLRMTKIR